MLSYKPTVTDTYYVAVYAAALEKPADPKAQAPAAGISLAVTYR
jgi:hypothetical protein